MSYAESVLGSLRDNQSRECQASVATEARQVIKAPAAAGARSNFRRERVEREQEVPAGTRGFSLDSRSSGKVWENDPIKQASVVSGVLAKAARVSFETDTHNTLVSRLKERKRLIRNKRLKPEVEELLKDGHLATLSSVLGKSKRDREALPILAEALVMQHAPGTTSSYASTWLRFVRWCKVVDKSIPMPAEPSTVLRYQAFLVREALERQLSNANAEAAIQAIRHFHECYGLSSPTIDPLVAMARKGIRRMLGTKGIQKKGLTNANVRQMYERFIVPDEENIGNVAMMCRIAMGQEGLLRFDDLNNLDLADILITKECLHIFIWEAKTDAKRQGQWALIHRDDAPWKAYPLVKRLVEMIQKQWGKIAKL